MGFALERHLPIVLTRALYSFTRYVRRTRSLEQGNVLSSLSTMRTSVHYRTRHSSFACRTLLSESDQWVFVANYVAKSTLEELIMA